MNSYIYIVIRKIHMDFKNLLSSLGALSNLVSNQNNPQPGQNFSGVQNAPPSSEQNPSVRYFPEDITSKPTQTQNFQSFGGQNQNVQNQNFQGQNLLSNLSSILPLLGLIFGKNSNLSSLISGNSNLGQILSLFSKQEEKKSLPSIDSYKKIE